MRPTVVDVRFFDVVCLDSTHARGRKIEVRVLSVAPHLGSGGCVDPVDAAIDDWIATD